MIRSSYDGMKDAVAALTDDDFAALLNARHALRRFLHVSEEAARGAGVTPAQHQLLLAVRGSEETGGPCIRDVADALVVAHHSAVELVDRCVGAGLVTRNADASDSRLVRLTLTPAGAAVLDRLTAEHLEELRALRTAFAGLTGGLSMDGL